MRSLTPNMGDLVQREYPQNSGGIGCELELNYRGYIWAIITYNVHLLIYVVT